MFAVVNNGNVVAVLVAPSERVAPEVIDNVFAPAVIWKPASATVPF